MFDLQRIHHTGTAVSNIAAAQAMFGEALSMAWSSVRRFEPLPFWTPDRGSHDLIVSATYSLGGPHHLELVEGPVGSFFDPALLPDARHIGVWIDDLAQEAERLCQAGWLVAGAAAAPDDGYGAICYLSPPTGGLLIELISTELEPMIAEWIAGDASILG